MRLTETQFATSAARRLTIATACVALGVGTCFSAFALRMHVDAGTSSDVNSEDQSSGRHPVPASEMQDHKLTGAPPVYPVEAKQQRIQGVVKLDAIINKDGMVENLQVVSGPKELQQSALDAVRQWTYKPYLVDGSPVEIETTINVTYSLAK